MPVYIIETVISEDRTIHLEALPFLAGQVVDVIVLARQNEANSKGHRSLKGTVLKYDRPLEPVAEDDWDDYHTY